MEPGSRSPAQAGRRVGQPAIIVQEQAWRRRVPGAVRIALRAAEIARTAKPANGTAPAPALTVVLASDRALRRLNARHRGRTRPTNVLSFPGSAEIVLALGVVCREAKAAGRRPGGHLAHLVMHGVLHLAGHDHHAPGEARRMALAEARLLHRLGVPNPWRGG